MGLMLGSLVGGGRVLEAVRTMIREHEAGAIDYVIPESEFSGGARETVRAINELVAAHIAVKMRVVQVATQYGQGDLSVEMDRLPGRKAIITDAMDGIRNNFARDLRLARALDVTATNVMVADSDYRIVYQNRSLQEMLRVAESDIKRDLPNFDAARIIGTNIDVFHKNPSHQRQMLDRLTDTHKTQLRLGGRTFSLLVSPVHDGAGRRVGTVVEWKDLTEQLALEEREKRQQEVVGRLVDEISGLMAGMAEGDLDGRISG